MSTQMQIHSVMIDALRKFGERKMFLAMGHKTRVRLEIYLDVQGHIRCDYFPMDEPCLTGLHPIASEVLS
jgi:hypothetical protein